MSNYAQVRAIDTANGEGIRTTIFVTGCYHNCKDCFNQEYQDFNYGKKFDKEIIKEILDKMREPYINGLSILGGEPLENVGILIELCEEVKKEYPEKDIWMWTGYTYEEVLNGKTKEKKEEVFRLLKLIDVVVDGRFNHKLKNLSLKFRGSSNQRILDMQKTLKEDKIVIKEL